MSHINCHKTALIVLAVLAIVVFAPISSAALVPYSQDFEGMTPAGGEFPNDLQNDGWVVYADVWVGSVGTGVFLYSYGPFVAPDGTGGFSAIASGEGGVNQGYQYLVTYSDYINPDQAAGGKCGSSGCIINTSVFQERNIDAGDICSRWNLTFDAKSPFFADGISDAAIDNLGNYLEYPTSASAFIKTLDPSSGYNTTNDIRVDMTNISNTAWSTFTISLDLSDPLLVGQILQFGFNTVTTEYDHSGVYYDNISFSQVANADIDVKPGSFPNSINVGSPGKMPVAILTTACFDAGSVDVSSIRFGPGEAHPVHYALEDVDGDTDWDLILHFKTQEVGIICGDTEVTIAGQTLDGVPVLETDSIRTVGCE